MKTLREVGQVVGCDGAALTSLREIAAAIDPTLGEPLSARTVLERGSVAKYTFTLEQIRITKTRALHNDTDFASVGVKVGDGDFISQGIRIGDVNDGVHHVGLSIGPIPIDGPDTPVVFNFQVVNSGHSNTEAAIATLIGYGKDMAEKYAEQGNMWGYVAAGGLALAGLLFADCDGAVAVDQIAVTESVLKGWTCASGSYSAPEKYYPGYDSATGCGSNSQYNVIWSARRTF